MKEKPPQLNVSIKDSEPIVCSCGNTTFTEAIFLRKISRLITASAKDTLVPIPAFICSACGQVCEELIPNDLKVSTEPKSLIQG